VILSTERALTYLSKVPLALGLERLAEASLYQEEELARPILDLGCGDGLFATLAFSLPLDFGVDPQRRELEVAGSLPSPYRELICAYGSDIPLPDNFVGSVVTNSVLEHIQELEPVLRETLRILKPSGKFVATIPLDKFEEYSSVAQILGLLRLGRAKESWCRLYNRFWRHHHAYNQAEWVKMFEASGFEVMKTHIYNSRRACLRNDLLAPFGAPAKAQKILFNRWTTLPNLRKKFLATFWRSLEATAVRDSSLTKEGGLIYIEARKPS
jgi:SAM-dependent methyltransferase